MKTQQDRDGEVEYIIAVLLQPIRQGISFTKWPLHITVVPWFYADKDMIIAALQRVGLITPAFTAQVGPEDWFGQRRTVPVNRVFSPELQSVHSLLIGELVNLTDDLDLFSDYRYMINDNYSPHITQRSQRIFNEGNTINVNKLSLLKTSPHESRLTRLKTLVYEEELQ